MADDDSYVIPPYPYRTVLGSGTPEDPRIFWDRNATKETKQMIDGVEKICKEACILMNRNLVVVRADSGAPNFFDTKGNIVKTAPFIEVALGTLPANNNLHDGCCDMEGQLFYVTKSVNDTTPARLATPWEACEKGGANPDMYEIETNNPHPNSTWIHEQFKKCGKVDKALELVMIVAKEGWSKAAN